MALPEVSVIIPTYNRASMLLRAVRSVLEQTYYNFKLIVVDDGSTDGTQESINQIQDWRKTYVKLEQNSGSPAKPRNIGIARAKGKYIIFLDSDDEWMPTLLEKLTGKMKTVNDRVGIIYCGLIYVNPQGNVCKINHPMLRGNLFPYMLGDTVGSISSSLIKRECFNKVGLFDVGDISEHQDMWIRLAKHYEFDYIPEALARYNLHQGQVTQSKSLITRREALLRKYTEDYIKYPRELRKAKAKIGTFYFKAGDRYKGLKYLLPYMIHDNHYWKLYVQLFILIVSPRLVRPLANLYGFLTLRTQRKMEQTSKK